MVLVDSSVWIDFLKKGSSKESRTLERLLAEEQDIVICGQIRQEVLQGIGDEVTLQRVRRLLDEVDYLCLEEPKIYDEAAQIYRTLKRKGKTLRSPADCLIAAVAIHAKVSLLHRDRDFETIADGTSLKVYKS